jgi:glycosyltransferase family protein
MIRLKIAKKMKISTKFIYFFNRLLNKFFKLNILDTNSSIDLLLDTNVSLARYGDGELNIMMGGDIHFQKYHPELAYRLKKLIKNNKNKQLEIGIPLAINTVEGYKAIVKEFWEMNMNTGRMHWFMMCGFKRSFLNASLTRCYIDYEDKSNSIIWFEKLMKLWQGKKLLIIEGEVTKLGVENSLFSDAFEIKRIITPATNVWDKYDVIINETLNVAVNFDLILASLGPTATVLAEDVSKQGFRILDIGHLNLEYNKYLLENKIIESKKCISIENYHSQVIKYIN